MKDAPKNDREERTGLLGAKAALSVLFIVINAIATGILFFLTVHDDEPFIAPMSEVSMILRWIVIAAVIAVLQSLFMLGWKHGLQDRERQDRIGQ